MGSVEKICCPAGEQRSHELSPREEGWAILNPSCTCLVDKWFQTHPKRAGKSSYGCGRLALVPREPIYVKYVSCVITLGSRETTPVRIENILLKI